MSRIDYRSWRTQNTPQAFMFKFQNQSLTLRVNGLNVFLPGEEDHAARGFRDLLQGRRHRRVCTGGSGSVQRARTPTVFAADRRTSSAERDLLHGRLGIHEPHASVLYSYFLRTIVLKESGPTVTPAFSPFKGCSHVKQKKNTDIQSTIFWIAW